MEVLKLFAPYGPGWLGGVLLGLISFYFGRQFLDEYKRQNQRKGELDLKREERKQAEVDERAQRDRERSEMEGRIAAQMERSNSLMEAMKMMSEIPAPCDCEITAVLKENGALVSFGEPLFRYQPC